MVSCFRRHKLIAVWHGVLAAIVGFGCGSAFALETAIRSLLIKPSAGEAVEGPNEQKNCYEGDGDLTTTKHFSFSRADPVGPQPVKSVAMP